MKTRPTHLLVLFCWRRGVLTTNQALLHEVFVMGEFLRVVSLLMLMCSLYCFLSWLVVLYEKGLPWSSSNLKTFIIDFLGFFAFFILYCGAIKTEEQDLVFEVFHLCSENKKRRGLGFLRKLRPVNLRDFKSYDSVHFSSLIKERKSGPVLWFNWSILAS